MRAAPVCAAPPGNCSFFLYFSGQLFKLYLVGWFNLPFFFPTEVLRCIRIYWIEMEWGTGASWLIMDEKNWWIKYGIQGVTEYISEKAMAPHSILLPGKSHGWRNLEGCSPWGRGEQDTTERLHFPFSLSCIGEGNGNPLQCSCLENPRDGGAWWAAVYGVAESRTRLKRLSSRIPRCSQAKEQNWISTLPYSQKLTQNGSKI